MNLVAPHLMVELRSAGFIEICGDLEQAGSAGRDAVGRVEDGLNMTSKKGKNMEEPRFFFWEMM